MKTQIALVLLLATTHALAQTACGGDSCAPDRLPDPQKPESGHNALNALGTITESMCNIIRAKGIFGERGSDLGYIGLGVLIGVRGFTEKDSSAWLQYHLEQDLVTMQDYLVCKMTQLVETAMYAASAAMTQEHLNNFNHAVDAVNDFLYDSCPTWNNCLTSVNQPPSNRSSICVTRSPNPVAVCTNITWDATQPVGCDFVGSSGDHIYGLCDPNGHCYNMGVSFGSAINRIKEIMKKFYDDSSIEYFNAFNDLRDARAVAAYAKAATLYVTLHQQLIMLGNNEDNNSTMKAFATRAANWLQDRYNWHTSWNSTIGVVQRASDPWANAGKVDSLYVRTSCVPSDIYDMPFSGARYSDDVLQHANESSTLCLTNKKLQGGADAKHWLVIGREQMCTWDNGNQYTRRISYKHFQQDAAQALANNIKKQFDDAKVPTLIESFRTLATEGMPIDSYGFFPRKGYPAANCGMPSPKAAAAARAARQQQPAQ